MLFVQTTIFNSASLLVERPVVGREKEGVFSLSSLFESCKYSFPKMKGRNYLAFANKEKFMST